MARSILDIVIKLSKQGGADRETVKGLVQVKSGLTQLGMVAGVVTGALYTAKKAFDFAKEGAQLQFVEQRFNRLADSIGANAGLMDDLREVTRGLYSETQLMTNASDLMGLGLAQNSDELLRLARVSAGLNFNMTQLVLTLTNMTTMRFDQLGVSVDGFKEKVAELEAAGMSAEDAFKEAFLQQAEAQLERVGEAADSTAGSFLRFEAGIANLKDSAKKSLAEGIEPLIRGMADLMEQEAAASQRAEEHAHFIDISKNAIRDLTGQVNVSTAQAAAFAHQLQIATDYDKRWIEVLQQTATTLTATAESASSFSMSLDTVQSAISGPILKAQEDYQKKLSDLNAELVDLQAQEDAWSSPPVGSQKYDELQERIAGVRDEIDNTTTAYQEQARQIMFNIAQEQILASSMAADQQARAISILGQSMGMWDQQTADAIANTSRWVSLLEEGSINADQFAVRANQMGASIFGVNTKLDGAITATAGLTGANMMLMDGFGGIRHTAPMAEEALGGVSKGLKETRQMAFDANDQVRGLQDGLAKLNGMHALATVTIVVNGSVPDLTRMVGQTAALRQMANFGGFLAEGGPLGGDMAIVGEQGWEAAVKDKRGRWIIVPHDVSKGLAELGLLDNVRGLYAGGGMDASRWSVRPPKVTGFGKVPRRRRERERRDNTPSDSTTSQTNTVEQETADIVAPLAEATEQAVASSKQAQMQQMVEGRLTRASMQANNDEMVGILKSIDDSLRQQENKITNAFKAAMQQVRP